MKVKTLNVICLSGILTLSLFNLPANAEENIRDVQQPDETTTFIKSEIQKKDSIKEDALNSLKQKEEEIKNNIQKNKLGEEKAETAKKEGKDVKFNFSEKSKTDKKDSANEVQAQGIYWGNWSYGDIILGNSPSSGSSSSVPYGYYRHGSTYDNYYGNFISAMPEKGVYRESKSFWSNNYSNVAGYYVPTASASQRANVIYYLRQQMGEPYNWDSSKTNYSSWYCTKLPYVAYRGNAAINIDSNGGYWATPDNVANDGDTRLFMTY